MKIALVCGGYPTHKQQILVFVQQLVEALINLGVDVTVIAPQSIVHCVVHHESLLPYKQVYMTKHSKEYVVYRPKYLSFGGRDGLLGIIAKKTLKMGIMNILERFQYDCIYTHFWSSCIPVYEFCAKARIPLFVACGEGDNALETMAEKMSDLEIEKLRTAVTGVICVSTENKRKCIQYRLADDKDIIVLPNCVDDSIFYPNRNRLFREKLGVSDTDFVVIFVGGFIHRKGPDRVASALKVLNDANIKSIFVGKFFDGEKVDPQCHGIVYKGPLHHDDLPKYLNAADLFVLPTLKEGCSNAIVEALACGVPVVSADRPFNDDILNEYNSIIVDPEDIPSIASAISLLKNDNSIYQAKKTYVLSHAGDYSIKERALKIMKFIESKIDEK